MKIEPCVRCGSTLKTAETINESGQPAVIAYTVLRTTGVRPMVRATARRRVLCMPCSISIGFGPAPQSGAFNEDVYEGCVELSEKCPQLAAIAHEQKHNPPTRPRLMPGSKQDETLTTKTLRAPFTEDTKLAS
jgi:hypothetical protein